MEPKIKFFLLQLVMVSMSLTVTAQQIDEWILKADPVKTGDYDYAGVTVANGMIGVVSSPHPFQVKDIVLAGAYDLYGRGRVSNFLRSFNILNMFLEADRHRLGVGNVTNMRQELNMKKAYFKSTFDFEDKLMVSVTYRALRHLPHTLLMDIEVVAKKDVTINTGSILQAPDALRNVENYHNEITIPESTMDLLTSTAWSPSGSLKVAASNAFIFSEKAGHEPMVIHEMLDNNMQQMRFSMPLKKGQTYQFSVVGSTMTSAHQKDPLNEVERLTIFARLLGRDKLVATHEQAWNELWATGDIQIEGDPQTQQDMRNMLYHLYSFVREGTGYSLSPMGLSGLGYNGHVFWDTEIWMYPALLVLQPQLAKNMVDYRFDRLEAAKRNAKIHGYKGAMFPWESADSGGEETPVWALSGPLEHHITGCVAIAAWNYYCVTQDIDWLEKRGWPVLEATADFWVSRVERNGVGKFDIKNVVGADEWAENVDNDAWTNAAAKANLNFANKAAMILGKKTNEEWQNVADNIPILKFESGVTKEHATYQGEPIKQADANLIAYPLKEVTDPQQILQDLEYYEKRVPGHNTPAMTKSNFALQYARVGKTEKAYEVFLDGYRPNMWGPFRVVMETPGSYNPYFATAAGGILQTLMMGFGGLEITDLGILQIKTALPKQWKSLKIIGVGIEDKVVEVK